VAKFKAELPNDLMKVFEDLETNSSIMMGEMCKAGAAVVYDKVVSGLGKAFKRTDTLLKGLKVTKVYETSSDDGINVHIGFYGYDAESASKAYPKGKPIPLIAMAREYGTSSGEKKKPFFRKSFAKKEIEQAMMEVQNRYIKDEGNE
jgi:hypothetical protein